MSELSPALLELLSQVVSGQATCDDLVREISDFRNQRGAVFSSKSISDASPPAPQDGSPREGVVDLSDPSVAECSKSGNQGLGNPDQIAALQGATVDLGRKARCGFGEVIYGPGKTRELIAQIISTQLDAGQSALVTRVAEDDAQWLTGRFQHTFHHSAARTLRVDPNRCVEATPISDDGLSGTIHAAVVSAGSTDAGVAQEAIETLCWMGVPYQRFDDIGVAGPQRLQAALPRLRMASAVVVVAGMEGALPSVVGGHLAVPIFAVPTSVGYGATLQGLTPMLGMLSACAANVAVVNIDAGFKGGYLAGLVVRQIERTVEGLSQAQKGASK